MAARRDVDRRETDRRGHDRDYDSRKHAAPSSRPQLNEYWIAGEGINRQVLQTEICKYLGAEATCRPGDYQGVPGFKIKALRPFTPDMLDDLRQASKAFQNENRAYVRRHDRGNTPSISPSPVPSPVNKIGGFWLTPPPELAYTDSRAYEQTNGQVDFQDSRPYTRDSPAFPTSSGSGYGAGPVSSAPSYSTSSAGFSGVSQSSAFAHAPATSQAPYQDHAYGHSQMRDRHDPRDVDMHNGPSYGNNFPSHAGPSHHPSGGFNDPYGGGHRGGDPRGDPRMGYEYGNGNSYGAPQRRPEPAASFPESMSGMSGPGASYGAPPPRGNAMYNDSGPYDSYNRGAPFDSRYGGRR